MNPFSQNVTPAAKTHMEAQVSFFNDMSKSLFRSFQQYCDLNIQLAQTLLEETARTGHEVITANRQTEVISAAASHAQPAVEKLRAYQQHLSRIAADTQVDLAKVAEEHVSETSRTAKALADEVARTVSEETEKTKRTQQETINKFTDPFEQFATGAQRQMRGNEVRAGASMQSAGHEAEGAGGSMQGGMQSGAQGTKQGGATRKE